MRNTNFFGADSAAPPSPVLVGEAAGAGSDAETLFQQLPWGMVVLDAQGTVLRLNAQAADWWGQLTQDTEGKPLGKLAAGTLPDDLWHTLQQVTSSPARALGEFFLPQHQQWIAMTIARQGDNWVVYWQDVTAAHEAAEALRQSEARQTYLLALSDALRPMADAVAVQATVTRTALQHFAADRCYYAEIAGDTATIRRDAARPGLPSVAGLYSLREMPLFNTVLRGGAPPVAADVEASLTVDDHLKQLCRENRIRAYLIVPVIRRGELVGALYLTQATPRAWTALEVALVQETAERTWAAVERARDEKALVQSEEKYRSLFDSIDEGFVVSELLYDEQGRAADARMLETNPSYDRITQTTGLAGRRAREVFPASETTWFEAYARVLETGESLRLESYFQPIDRWIAMYVSRVGGAGSHRFASVFTDVTARKRHEHHAIFLDELSQALAVLDGYDEIVRVTGERLGAYLGVGFFNVVDVALAAGDEPEEARITVASAWEREGLPSPRGTYRAGDYLSSEFLRAARAGEALVIRDTDTDPRVDAAAYRALGMRAFVAVPVLHNGAWPGLVSAFLPSPRDWRPDEVTLLVEVAHRVFPRIERARTEVALGQSEAKYRTLFETMDQGFGVGEVLPGGPGRPADFRWLEVNPQVERLTSMPQAALLSGESMRTVMPLLEDIWYERYERVALTGEPVRFEQHAEVLGRWFDVYAYPLDLDGPAPYRVALLFTNITARKQAEGTLRHVQESHRAELEQQVAERTEELRESRNLLQTVFDASPTSILVLHVLRDAANQPEDLKILISNEFTKRIVGRDDLDGQRYSAVFPHTLPTGILARLLAVARTGEPADFEQWYETENIRHWFRIIVVRQADLLVVTAEVITARKLLEQGQARSLALLQQSEAVAGMGSWEYDLRTHEFTWSDGLYRLFDQPVNSVVKLQFLLDAVLDDDRPAAARLVRTLTAEPRSFDTTLRLRIGEMVKTVRFKAVPLPDAPGAPERVLGVCLDVSDVQRLEAENLALKLDRHKELLLAILQAQETERQRLGEVLHNGLGQILFATKLRLDQLDTPTLQALPAWAGLYQETARLLAEAMRQNRTLAHELVPTSLLNFGLAAAVRDVCRDLSTPQLRIACQVWGEEPEQEKALPQPVQVTLFRLAQELALNIVRHAGATEATLELETMASGVSLRAEDNGHGFDPRTVAEGLGLRTVRDAVALLGGTVAVDSSPEFGTHIRLRIPLPLFS